VQKRVGIQDSNLRKPQHFWKMPRLWIKDLSASVFHRSDNIVVGIIDGHFNGDTAVQAVSGTGNSWVIGAHRHFHLV
jgi:hypothetical protein